MDSRPYVQTYTAVVGDKRCNAYCPYCVSKMTPCPEFSETTNWSNFERGAKLAEKWGATTFLITSKGEATLHRDKVFSFANAAGAYFPIIELQTNGILLPQYLEERDSAHGGVKTLDLWKTAGLTTIALSSVGPDWDFNKSLISRHYPDPHELIPNLREKGFCVRLSVIMVRDGVDSMYMLRETIRWANRIGVDQLKVYPVNRPKSSDNSLVYDWVGKNCVSESALEMCEMFLKEKAVAIRQLAHGDTVYSYKDDTMKTDQNVAFGSCLTEGNPDNEIRQLIFCGDGHVRYSWQYEAAILF